MKIIAERIGLGIILGLFLPGVAAADVKLPRIFNDNMVLQRNTAVPVWGWAGNGEKLTVRLGDHAVTTHAGADGKWKVMLPPMEASEGPLRLEVRGTNAIAVENIAIGELWVCSGQSNMAMRVGQCLDAKKEISEADYPLIRHFHVSHAKSREPLDDLVIAEGSEDWMNKWQVCSPDNVKNFTGTGYFFARELNRRLGVPVGIIHASWGGTTAEAWTGRKWLENDPYLRKILYSWPGYTCGRDWLVKEYCDYLNRLERAENTGESKPVFRYQPSVLFNAMIAPLIPYAIRGGLWYQGEANNLRAFQYRRLFPAMIGGWRKDWGQGNFPFIFMQLPNCETGTGTWPYLREAQAFALHLPNTAMAVGIDIGEADNVHPANKQETGRRLALAALGVACGKEPVFSGPVFDSFRVLRDKCLLTFSHTGEGLTAKDSAQLKGFRISGFERSFFEAEAIIKGDTVIVWSEKVLRPVAVRYAWADNPTEFNLWNMYKGRYWLPAVPFRTDDW